MYIKVFINNNFISLNDTEYTINGIKPSVFFDTIYSYKENNGFVTISMINKDAIYIVHYSLIQKIIYNETVKKVEFVDIRKYM